VNQLCIDIQDGVTLFEAILQIYARTDFDFPRIETSLLFCASCSDVFHCLSEIPASAAGFSRLFFGFRRFTAGPPATSRVRGSPAPLARSLARLPYFCLTSRAPPSAGLWILPHPSLGPGPPCFTCCRARPPYCTATADRLLISFSALRENFFPSNFRGYPPAGLAPPSSLLLPCLPCLDAGSFFHPDLAFGIQASWLLGTLCTCCELYSSLFLLSSFEGFVFSIFSAGETESIGFPSLCGI